jgi:hypothetical protein
MKPTMIHPATFPSSFHHYSLLLSLSPFSILLLQQLNGWASRTKIDLFRPMTTDVAGRSERSRSVDMSARFPDELSRCPSQTVRFIQFQSSNE